MEIEQLYLKIGDMMDLTDLTGKRYKIPQYDKKKIIPKKNSYSTIY